MGRMGIRDGRVSLKLSHNHTIAASLRRSDTPASTSLSIRPSRKAYGLITFYTPIVPSLLI